MKKTDTLIKVASLLAFIAMAAYLTVYIVGRALDPVQTALTVTATMSDAAPMSGLVIRNELVIRSDEQYIDVTAADGAKVAAGETVAVAYSSEEALERASRMHVLSREIEDVSAALDSTATATGAGDREESIYSAIIGLSGCLRGGDLSELDSRSGALAGVLFPTNVGGDASEEYLRQLKDEYDGLRTTAAGDTKDITVGQSGTFSTLVDGYEGVDPDYVRNFSPDELAELIAAERVVESSSIGKLITSYDWYYAAAVPWDDSKHLREGDWVKLDFGRYFSGELDAEVERVGQAENDQQLIIFRLERGQTEMLAVRAVTAELIYEEYTGLRVPVRGLYRYYAGYMSDEDGQSLREGQTVTLTFGEESFEAFVSEIGSASKYGSLPPGFVEGVDEDVRPSRRLVVFCWHWEPDSHVPDSSAGGGFVSAGGREMMTLTNYYDYRTLVAGMDELPDDDPAKWNIPERLCVFTMTGMQAERKLVSLVYAGEEYCLLSSEGNDALREGNEVIIRTSDLYNGRVFS